MPRNRRSLLIFLLTFGLCVFSIADESATRYFPNTIGSSWVYVDQYGKEMTRSAIVGKEIDGSIYQEFTYQPELEESEKYQHIMYPSLYQIGEKWVSFFVGDEIESATKSILSKKLDETVASLRLQIAEQLPTGIAIEFDYSVEPNAQDYFYLFPISNTYDEEWIAMQMEVEVNMTMDITGAPVDPSDELKTITSNTTIEEKGKIIGKETIETSAGKFKDCLKIEFSSISTTDTTLPPRIKQLLPEDETKESVSTVWLAPNVGLVKFISGGVSTDPEISYELKSYEIKTETSAD